MLRRLSCAVWKLAPDEEPVLGGGGYLAVLSSDLESYHRGGWGRE